MSLFGLSDVFGGEQLKQDGHLLTTNCDILPSPTLRTLGKMGRKFRPHDCSSHFDADSKSAILSANAGGHALPGKQDPMSTHLAA